MARPAKKGLDYYSTDTDRYNDIKIKRLRKDFGCVGLAVWDYLLNEIYRVEGSFLQWDEHTAFDVADYFTIKESTVIEIVNYCCGLGLFHKELFTSENVLTSEAIQNRYIKVCKDANRTSINLSNLHDLVGFYGSKPQFSTQETELSPPTSTQRKGKESKVKREKKKNGNGHSLPPRFGKGHKLPEPSLDDFEAFRENHRDTIISFAIERGWKESYVKDNWDLFVMKKQTEHLEGKKVWNLSNPAHAKMLLNDFKSFLLYRDKTLTA